MHFNDVLQNVLARSTPEYCKWHPRVPRRLVGKHWFKVLHAQILPFWSVRE